MKSPKLAYSQRLAITLNLLADHFPAIFKNEQIRFADIQGKKAAKADGSLIEKLKPAPRSNILNGDHPNGRFTLTWYIEATNKAICLRSRLSVTFSYGDGDCDVMYENFSANLCEYVDDKVGPLFESELMPERYDHAQILEAAKAAEVAAEAYNKALASVPYQFRESLYLKRLTY